MLTEKINVPRLVPRYRIPYSSPLFGNSFVGLDAPFAPGVRVPTTRDDFTVLGIVAPNHLWLSQEASGNLTDSIGGVTLAANGTPTYGNAVSGWTRKGLGFDETANQRFSVAAGTGPNPATTSVAWMCYFRVTSDVTSTNRRLLIAADGLATTGVLCNLTLNGGQTLVRIVCVSVGANGTYDYNDGNVHPALLVYDRTNSLVRIYTDKEQLNGTYDAGAVDAAKGICAAGSGNSILGNVLWAAAASGSTAEGYGKHTLTALGWGLSY